MITVRTVQNDKLYTLQFTLQNNDGTPFDLTDAASIAFLSQFTTDPAINATGAMTVSGDPEDGVVDYQVGSGVFGLAGTYNAQIVVTMNDTGVVTFADINVIVEPKIPITP